MYFCLYCLHGLTSHDLCRSVLLLAHNFHHGMADHDDNKPFGGFGGFGGFGDFGNAFHFTEETTSRRKCIVLKRC